jgi:hypothetical protein
MIPVVAPPLDEPSGRTRWFMAYQEASSTAPRCPIPAFRSAQAMVEGQLSTPRAARRVARTPNKHAGAGHRARTWAVSLGVCAALVAIIASRRRSLEN